MIPKPIKVKALPDYCIWLKYQDGTEGKIDLSGFTGKGVFLSWGNKRFFNQVYIDKQSQSIAWDDLIQFCPNSLYFQLKGIDFEEWKKENEVYGTN